MPKAVNRKTVGIEPTNVFSHYTLTTCLLVALLQKKKKKEME